MDENYENAKVKLKEEANQRNAVNTAGMLGVTGAQYRDSTPMQYQTVGQGRRPYTLREEAGKSAEHHRAESQKHSAAYDFLSAHPEFDEFIRLVRSGAIQF
jgi:hypothetical protein